MSASCRRISSNQRAPRSEEKRNLTRILSQICTKSVRIFYCKESLPKSFVLTICAIRISVIYTVLPCSLPRAEEVLWCDLSTCIHGIVHCMSCHCVPPHCIPLSTYPQHGGFGWDLNANIKHQYIKYINSPCLGAALFRL